MAFDCGVPSSRVFGEDEAHVCPGPCVVPPGAAGAPSCCRRTKGLRPPLSSEIGLERVSPERWEQGVRTAPSAAFRAKSNLVILSFCRVRARDSANHSVLPCLPAPALESHRSVWPCRGAGHTNHRDGTAHRRDSLRRAERGKEAIHGRAEEGRAPGRTLSCGRISGEARHTGHLSEPVTTSQGSKRGGRSHMHWAVQVSPGHRCEPAPCRAWKQLSANRRSFPT